MAHSRDGDPVPHRSRRVFERVLCIQIHEGRAIGVAAENVEGRFIGLSVWRNGGAEAGENSLDVLASCALPEPIISA